ncbi:MAG TPA: hypothetical protein VMD09_17220 [Solirubrobacteraceae bacterium]|nr:hypothetical protein [Solirubrobacteraceae bacterium]
MGGVRSFLLAVFAGLALAACGSSSPASSPLGSSLSYFPKDSPFVVSVTTAPQASAVKSAQAMLARIPFANFGQAALMSRLQQIGVNYDTDIRPLFGNPLVFGLVGSGSAGQQAVVVWVTKDAGTLSSLIKKLQFRASGRHGGATLYQASNFTLAVAGATLIGGESPAVVDAAIDRHASGSGMSAALYDSELGSLPRNGLVEAAGNLTSVLASSARTSKALSIPWVGALRGYGVAITAGSGGLSFRYTLDTSGKPLNADELPIAPGSSPPGLAGSMPIQVGLRQPAATLAFVLQAERLTAPAKYAADVAEMNAVRRRTGVDFQRDILGQMGNSAAVESTGHGFIARVDVNDPAAATQTLRKLGTSALGVFGTHPGAHVTSGPAGFEAVHTPHSPTILFGIVGSEFVVGTATPAQLRAFAAAPAAAATGAQGAVAFRIALPQLIQLTLHHPVSGTVRQVLSVLGDITGWVSASPSALSGNATLAVK